MLYNCPFCHNQAGQIYKKNALKPCGDTVDIYKCNVCSTFYPRPRMDREESFNYLGKMGTNQEIFHFEDPTRPIDPRDSLKKFLKKFTPCIGNALDVGTFDGRFCFILAATGFKAYGIEPQDTAAEFARGCGLDVFTGVFPRQVPLELRKIKFDLISFMESIYYCDDLKDSLQTAKDMLNDRGLLLIKAHQGSSRFYAHKPQFCRYGDYVQWVPMYDSLKFCLEMEGFRIVKALGTNPAELLPFGLRWMKNLSLAGITNKVYNRLMLDYTLWDIRRADRLFVLARKS